MKTATAYATRLFAVMGAFAISASLMLGSFSMDPQVQHIAGVIA